MPGEPKPRIERNEVFFADGAKDNFHCQAIPVFHPAGLIISEPNKTYSIFIPYGAIKKAKLNIKATINKPSQIIGGQGPVILNNPSRR